MAQQAAVDWRQAAPRRGMAQDLGRLARFNEIVAILLRHNAWGLLRNLMRGAEDREDREPNAVRLRKLLEELGPTFIKLGQLLATRPDLVPQQYVEEFGKLYDQTPPSPPEEVRRVLREELGREVEEVFAQFDPVPLASASIGQVHRATLADGTRVAVKVQHVGIEARMVLDFEILRGLVTFIEKTFAGSRVWQPSDHLEELRQMLERELDYRYEMRTTQRVAEDFRGDPTVKIPRMHPEHCGKRVLVMEFIDGTKLTRAPDLAGIDRRAVARALTTAMAKQIFVHRLFHADPSPGNLMVIGTSQVAFLDFGAVGVVTERRARTILQLITSISRKDPESAAEAIMDLCDQRAEVDPRRFLQDVERIVDHFEREEVSVADPVLMDRIVGLARSHKMLLPPDFALITRALFQFEGFCRVLDPDFDLVEVLQPFVAQVLWRDLSSPRLQKELVEETVGELLKFGRTLPHTLNTVLRKIERNEVTTRWELVGLEGIKSAQGRGVLKTSFTLMMAALIVGLALVYASPAPAARVGQFLFGAAAVLAVWTLVMLLWSEAFKGNRE
ncbi:MAG TPA: AarF/ABC1/UbiB kinase family protein [Candidatus Thermoplasmatota archaeon]|nr:AarF/ABC1/UbiB kinase family protein [Candidatus Thermoplasmatota archaeon]